MHVFIKNDIHHEYFDHIIIFSFFHFFHSVVRGSLFVTLPIEINLEKKIV